MWCHHCQQDVPAVSGVDAAGVHCARCQQPLAKPTMYGSSASDTRSQPGIEVEAWTAAEVLGDSAERLQRIGLALKATRARTIPSSAEDGTAKKVIPSPGQIPAEEFIRFDPPIELPKKQPSARYARHRQSTIPSVRDAARPSQASAWIAALVGAIALGAGVGLLVWSLFGPRPDLWSWGLATTLGGQGLMIVGLVQLLANLWTGNRAAANKLMTLHYELRRLQRSTDSLTGMRAPSPTAFYADLAKGSSPQVLLSNLKGQLDEVTTKLARE